MNSTNIIYALLAGVLPALLWLWFWLREDNIHPEPKTLIAFLFIFGGLGVLLAMIFERTANDFIFNETFKYIVWAGIEEIIKFSVVVLLAFRSPYLDEPIDLMIYCITAALGFSAFENALFVLTPLDSGEFAKTIIVGNLRFIGATLLHIVSSAVIGFTIALAFYKSKFKKIIFGFFGIILSITLHASFNLAIISGTAKSTLKVFGWVWCAIVILIILFEEVKAVGNKLPEKIPPKTTV